MTLVDLKVGQTAVITSVGCEMGLKKRLSALGVFLGVKIKIIRYAPFNGPVEIFVRGYNLAIRKTQAKKILVERYE